MKLKKCLINASFLIITVLILTTNQFQINDDFEISFTNKKNKNEKSLLNNAQLITLFNRQYQRQPYWYASPSHSSIYPPTGLGSSSSSESSFGYRSNNIGSNLGNGGLSVFSLDQYPPQFYDSYIQPIMTPPPSKATRSPSFRLEKKQQLQQQLQQYQIDEQCGMVKPKIGNFVHKGQPTEHHTWPWHVQLTIAGNDASESETYCGGTLIAKNLILTAAHCYDDLQAVKRAKNTQILFKGIENINLKQQLFSSQRTPFSSTTINQKEENFLKMRALFVHIHPKYVPALSEYDAKLKGVTPGPVFDLALIEIQHDSQDVYDSLMPICLPSDNYQLSLGSKCKIMGHGFMNAMDEDNFVMPSVLQMADVTISSNQACRDEVESESIKSKITENTLCIRGPIHPCVGDSGGPLLCTGKSSTKIDGDNNKHIFNVRNRNTNSDYGYDEDFNDNEKKWYLMGVTSFAVSTDSNDKCGQFKSAVFGKVSHVKDWIKSFIQF